MVKNTPEVLKLLKRFENQEHRIEINDCEVLYNGKSFFLGNTLEEAEAVFGRKCDYSRTYIYVWKNPAIKISRQKHNEKIDRITIYLADSYKEIIKSNDNVILINGAPLTKEMTFGRFIQLSNYDFNNFSIYHSFQLMDKQCDGGYLPIIDFDSNPIFKHSGGGHLQVRGDFDPKTTYPVDKISIYNPEK